MPHEIMDTMIEGTPRCQTDRLRLTMAGAGTNCETDMFMAHGRHYPQMCRARLETKSSNILSGTSTICRPHYGLSLSGVACAYRRRENLFKHVAGPPSEPRREWRLHCLANGRR